MEREPRVNERIRVTQVRLIDMDGAQLGIKHTREALDLARSRELDLVEVAPSAKPPVCRIMDYGKYKYQIKKRQQEARKKQVMIRVKEVKFTPKTDDHDLQFKVQHIKRFLEEHNKVKITVVFKGREIVHAGLGKQMIDRILQEAQSWGALEQSPRLEGKNFTAVLAPK
ncbi:MAG: translation initiation factor IF-3 [Deltaproteobacteria bacterium]|nr:translation initiation factor IF-3 [Deltaproteobacteria bacterium]